MKKGNFLKMLLSLVVMVAFFSCKEEHNSVKLDSVFTIDKSEIVLNVEKSATIKSTVFITNTDGKVVSTNVDRKVKWSSSNDSVATVNSNGVVTGVKGGTAIITATAVDKELTCTVRVKDIYVAGSVGSADATMKGMVWVSKNNGYSKLYQLGTDETRIHGLYVAEGAVVYTSGYEKAGKKQAKIWKNDGVKYTLSDGTNDAEAYSVIVDGSIVYAVGYENDGVKNIAKVWKNGVASTLATTASVANSVLLNGADVYAAGYAENLAGKKVATVWKSGKAQSLTDGTADAVVKSIAMNGNDLYAAGYEKNEAGKDVAKVWKNNQVLYSFAVEGSEMRINSIVFDGDDVYFAGYQLTENGGNKNAQSKAWKNGKEFSLYAEDLKGSSDKIEATSIFVSLGETFISGCENGNEETFSSSDLGARLWRNQGLYGLNARFENNKFDDIEVLNRATAVFVY